MSVQVFLKSVMSFLERAFESHQDDVMNILKNLQVRFVVAVLLLLVAQ